MQIEIPDFVVDALRDALTPVIDHLVDERVEERPTLLVSVSQVAEELSCSRSSVFGLIHGGHLEAIRIGRPYRVATATLQDYVDELSKPAHQREVVRARSSRRQLVQPARTSRRTGPRDAPVTSVLPATKPPRPPRARQKKVSKKEIADSRWTVSDLAVHWWGMEAASVLLARAGVDLVVETDERGTFRYGDLTAWVEDNYGEFARGCDEFDPSLQRATGPKGNGIERSLPKPSSTSRISLRSHTTTGCSCSPEDSWFSTEGSAGCPLSRITAGRGW